MMVEHDNEPTIKECFSTAASFLMKHGGKKITQDEMAKATGLSQTYIAKLVSGRGAGTETTRRKVAAALGFDGSEEGKSYQDFLDIGYEVLKLLRNPEKKRQETIKNTHGAFLDEKPTEASPVETFLQKPLTKALILKLAEIERTDNDCFLFLLAVISLAYNFCLGAPPPDSEHVLAMFKAGKI